MASLLKKKFTPAEYLALERRASEKHEFFAGDEQGARAHQW